MTLALVVVYCLSLGCFTPGIAAQPAAPRPAAASYTMAWAQESTPSTQPTPAPQSPDSAAPQAAPSNQTQNPPAKPPAVKPRRRRKKTEPPDCSTAPTALNAATGNPAGSTDTTSSNPASGNAASSGTVSSNTASPAQKPCPPPKVVVKNGGSDEPTVELKGGSTAEASYERATTEQLVKDTSENLNKIKGLQLTPSQHETVTQINHFLEQSKAAIAAGNVERGRNLAMKARLLSDELLKP
jgi:hypothetical protein